MAKETQKAKIERLEIEVENYSNIISSQNKLILKMQSAADENFENSPDFIQMKKRIDLLETKVKALADTAEHNRKLYEYEIKSKEDILLENKRLNELINRNYSKHNERGAGRKPMFSEEEIATIQMYRFQGKKLKDIAEMFNCSVSLIHKIINEK